MSIDRLVQACREDTAVLTSLRSWLDEEREKIKERLVHAPSADVAFLQGEARVLSRLRNSVSEMVRGKSLKAA